MKDPITSSESYLGSVTGNCLFLFFSQNNTRVFGPFPSSPPQKKKNEHLYMDKGATHGQSRKGSKPGAVLQKSKRSKKPRIWPPTVVPLATVKQMGHGEFPISKGGRGALMGETSQLPTWRFWVPTKKPYNSSGFCWRGFWVGFLKKKKKRPAGTIKLATWGLKKGEPLENQPVIIPYPC